MELEFTIISFLSDFLLIKISNFSCKEIGHSGELNLILEELENNEFIKVEEKKGLFGKKIELGCLLNHKTLLVLYLFLLHMIYM